MITTNMHKHPPQTPNEIIDLGYVIYSCPDFNDFTKVLPEVFEWTNNFKK